ncbi:outer membrane lipoprotein carrier protein LolA [Eikenella sp. S3360]|uniref:Outer membrane lipoprotein carrier protein LolA n=1 Tax=Eikenella glucosivorans TaxID=2766967 RepID=A0ABS0N7F6_9NEIS|nr:outer membrane lipoprotein carrier protein LolA [Eikenella glucosivorans]MBH5328220.1 outer membrane lipoprotein carrier protein LolA [Eikenella glucosivorans]
MKKRLLSLLLALAALPALAFNTAELTAQLQAPQSVQGSFTQQRFLRSLDKPVQTGGQFALRPGHGLFWHLQKPFDMKLRVRRDGITRQDSQGQWRSNGSQTAQAAQVKLFMAVLGGDTAELQRHFNLALSGNAQQWRLTLTPKTAVMRQVFNQIVISGGRLVQKVELDEKQGDRTVMQFTQLQTDRPLSPAARQALGE